MMVVSLTHSVKVFGPSLVYVLANLSCSVPFVSQVIPVSTTSLRRRGPGCPRPWTTF